MKIMIAASMVMLLLASGFIFISYDKSDNSKVMSEDDWKDIDFEITQEDINKAEELYEESLENQIPFEEQLEELRRVENKLYGEQISDFDAIRNR